MPSNPKSSVFAHQDPLSLHQNNCCQPHKPNSTNVSSATTLTTTKEPVKTGTTPIPLLVPPPSPAPNNPVENTTININTTQQSLYYHSLVTKPNNPLSPSLNTTPHHTPIPFDTMYLSRFKTIIKTRHKIVKKMEMELRLEKKCTEG